jgi:pimeloyl-ACP methyl ester carboxylesterase
MQPDISYREGDPGKPLVIFIHGLGIDGAFWTDPGNSRILGGKYPLRLLIPGTELKNSFYDLSSLGFPSLTWSQKRPAGEAMAAFEELQVIAAAHADRPLILIGHSRGGLLARMLAARQENVRLAITIGSPHCGSEVARWAERLSPLAAVLGKVLDTGKKTPKSSPVAKVLAFLCSQGLKEMLPDSAFIQALPSVAHPGCRAVSIGGTDPSFIRLEGKTILSVLSDLLPGGMLPDELREGLGDGMVSAASSVWPAASGHTNFYAHHGALPFHRGVREYIVNYITSLDPVD